MNNAATINSDDRGIATQQRNATTKPSLRSAINAKCRECIYCPLTGTGSWRLQVENCTSISCPLYSVRPKSIRYMPDTKNGLENPELGPYGTVSDHAGVAL